MELARQPACDPRRGVWKVSRVGVALSCRIERYVRWVIAGTMTNRSSSRSSPHPEILGLIS